MITVENEKSATARRTWFISILPVIFICAYPPLFLYFQNADEAKFSNILMPMVSFILAGIVLFVIFSIIAKSDVKSSVISSLFILFFLNHKLVEKLAQKVFPNLRYWHIMLIGVFVLVNLSWFIIKKVKDQYIKTISFLLSIVFIFLIVLNAIFAIPTYVKKLSYNEKSNDKFTRDQTNTIKSDLPNIYYIVLDEYSSVEFMKKYYAYDNSKFTDYLEESGFSISHTSHNESIMTSTVMTNIVNLDYVVDNTMLESEKQIYRKNNALFKLLSDKGYEIIGVGNAEFYGLENAAANEFGSSTTTVKGETISDLLYKQTIIWPFYSASYTSKMKNIISALNYLKDANNFPSGGRFTFCHVNCPHEPFFFKENGGTYKNPTSDWENSRYYLGQYIFTTNQVFEIVDSISKNDPYSCIIIQSDHGARASSNSELFMEKFTLEDMSNFFNAVYLKGKKLDIEGLSAVNTLRLVLNEILDEDFQMVDVPVDTYKYK